MPVTAANILEAAAHIRGQVVATPCTYSRVLSKITGAEVWLNGLIGRFQAWPSSHRTRSILMAEDDEVVTQSLDINSNY